MRIDKCIGCMEETRQYPCPHCGFDPAKAPRNDNALPYLTILNGRYLVGKVLGQGGFGITYIGWDREKNEKVAVKELLPSGMAMRHPANGTALYWSTDDSDPQIRERETGAFLREARKMLRVQDVPQVVNIRDAFRENNTAYIVMDYIQGITLREYVAHKGTLSWKKVHRLFLPVISAMEQVHAAGLIHRDISPDNLMLLHGGEVKILDFGAAKGLITKPGVSPACGYIPPEQYAGQGASGTWTDVYAMAATIYFCLTGQNPQTAVDRVEEDRMDWQLPAFDDVPAAAVRGLRRAMEVSPAKRLQSMAELAAALSASGAPSGKNAGQVAAKQQKRNQKKSERRTGKFGLLAATAAVILLAGLLVPRILNSIKNRQQDNTMETETAQTEPVYVMDEQEFSRLLSKADALAVEYDYERAAILLESAADLSPEQQQRADERAGEYRELMSRLREWSDVSMIPNLSFHVLIADPDRAFTDPKLGTTYNRQFVTTDEFTWILEELYRNGCVLVDYDSCLSSTPGLDGRKNYYDQPILLPEGKRPIMLTETMVNYYGYMIDSDQDGLPDAGGDGFASRLVVDEDGEIRAEIVDADGETSVGSFDFVPILEDFLKQHPDFSFRGARATLAVSGSEGIFGYRINSSYAGDVSREYQEQQIIDARQVVRVLREKGYTFACYSYDNIAYQGMASTQIKADLQQWDREIQHVLGTTEILVFARESDLDEYSGPAFEALRDHGFTIFVGNGTEAAAEICGSYVRQSRLMVTGSAMAWRAAQFEGLFDCSEVLDTTRRGAVPN